MEPTIDHCFSAPLAKLQVFCIDAALQSQTVLFYCLFGFFSSRDLALSYVIPLRLLVFY